MTHHPGGNPAARPHLRLGVVARISMSSPEMLCHFVPKTFGLRYYQQAHYDPRTQTIGFLGRINRVAAPCRVLFDAIWPTSGLKVDLSGPPCSSSDVQMTSGDEPIFYQWFSLQVKGRALELKMCTLKAKNAWGLSCEL